MKSFFGLGKRQAKPNKNMEFVIEDDGTESDFVEEMRINLARLIVYSESADPQLQREVAERLANEAVHADRQVQIVECGGLDLLLPLTRSEDNDVQRLSAHALANLSVNADNQVLMAEQGGIKMMVRLLEAPNELTQRQAAKAIANMSVTVSNKRKVVQEGATPGLVGLLNSDNLAVQIEGLAALANLAVDHENELEIVRQGGLGPIMSVLRNANSLLLGYGMVGDTVVAEHLGEIQAQGARCLRFVAPNPNPNPNPNPILNLCHTTPYHFMIRLTACHIIPYSISSSFLTTLYLLPQEPDIIIC
jgi:vacuolar protein 8